MMMAGPGTASLTSKRSSGPVATGGGGAFKASHVILLVNGLVIFAVLWSLAATHRLSSPSTAVAGLHHDALLGSANPDLSTTHHALLRGGIATGTLTTAQDALSSFESIESLRKRLPPSVWTTAGRDADPDVAKRVLLGLTKDEIAKSQQLCGKFLYSSLQRAVLVQNDQVFVATGDIDDMWTRDGSVQMGIYLVRMTSEPWLRSIVEGSLRRHAFNVLQDPYANAYERYWTDPSKLPFKERIIGRGGWVATRNYEVDSGAYFLTSLYDYYVVPDLFRPEALLQETVIFDAVNLLIDVYIVEQEHDSKSPYRYFELPNNGLGSPTSYTGMTWSGFRPSDDPTKYGYLIPSNVHAAAGLERILVLNERIWKSSALEKKTRKLLSDISEGINKYGIVLVEMGGETLPVYAYEVDGMGKTLTGFDDANVPSLLSIPLLGWSGYNRTVYENTRRMILSKETNSYYFEGSVLRGVGSPHTPTDYVWSMTFSIQALTEEGSEKDRASSMAFQIRQSLAAACNDAMHESVHVNSGCSMLTREWFEWSNALFVVLWESSTGERCDTHARNHILQSQVPPPNAEGNQDVYQDQFGNNRREPLFYQGIAALVPYDK